MGFVFAVQQFIVTRDVRAVVADIAEKGAERSLVVEREGQGADGAGGDFKSDAHVHRDPQGRDAWDLASAKACDAASPV